MSSGKLALPLADAIYPERQVRLAAERIAGVAAVAFERATPDLYTVTVEVSDPHLPESRAVIGSFLNEALRLTLRARLETRPTAD